MEIIDNKRKTLKDDLSVELKKGSKVSIAAASFSIYAYEELKKSLQSIDELRFIFTSPTFVAEKTPKQKREFYIPRLDRERSVYGSEFEIKLRNELLQRAISKECAEWIRKKVKFKSNTTDETMGGFLTTDEACYSPINSFTTVDLGCERGNMAYTMINKLGCPQTDAYLDIFNQLWNDNEKMQDVTEQVIDTISNAYKENSPEFIYFVALYNIFHEFLLDVSEDELPNEATGFKASLIWNKLYNFQKDAALGIINKLEKYNGCILADSVGLGKTFTALAVIKYYECRNKNVLVLCPKKLSDNWTTYRNNYENNPIYKDRLRYDVLYHTDLSRTSGYSNGLNLANFNWSTYDLVVIDESHNFRNGAKNLDKDNEEENRYSNLLNKVIRQGVKTKVLMLSATPVNNRFNDLKNQLQLAYEGDTKKMNDLLDVSNSIDDIFKSAQRAYNEWTGLDSSERTTQNLLDKLSFDFFEVLDAVTIARSRKHIEKYYDTADIGKFPNRLKPVSRQPKLTDLTNVGDFNCIFTELDQLNMSIYCPSRFILDSKKAFYNIFDDEDEPSASHKLTIIERELGICRLMRINLLKRLESSVNSFRLSVEKILDFINKTLDKLDKYNPDDEVDDFDFGSIDDDDIDETVFVGKRKNRIRICDMDFLSWRKEVEADKAVFEALLDEVKDITPDHDSKLMQLVDDLKQKIANPFNPDNKKVVVFTAFADTAEYLYQNLSLIIKRDCGLDSALVSGTNTRYTVKPTKKKSLDFNDVLILFSPISKEKESNSALRDEKASIDLLIATDCISEGQNLQDCDYLVNYDIHWNPVRIIQRFGRIDRIGSRNDNIQLVNYWPDMTLDDYINLKSRVESRMKISVMTSTGDDNPIAPEEKGDLEYRREQLKKLKEEVVDLEEMNNGISIVDLGLNDFHLDLLGYMKDNPNLEHTPMGLHAVVNAKGDVVPGVVYILKNVSAEININNRNQLHPFYLVYITNEGRVVVNHLSPKQILDKMRFLCRNQKEPINDLCKLFNTETKDGKDMNLYSHLLNESINSIIDVGNDRNLNSLLSGGEFDLFAGDNCGLNSFELICFLVIK